MEKLPFKNCKVGDDSKVWSKTDEKIFGISKMYCSNAFEKPLSGLMLSPMRKYIRLVVLRCGADYNLDPDNKFDACMATAAAS